MRKFFAFFALLLPLFLFAGCDAAELGSLPDLSMPYTGVYECERLDYGGRDRLEGFEWVRLELKYDGTFALGYRTKTGSRGSLSGEYEVDAERETITFRAPYKNRQAVRTFPMPDGAILIEENLLGKPLFAEFRL